MGNREITVSEFFSRNKHLLGFSSLSRSLLIAVKEAVDNSLDACDESKVLPKIFVDIKEVKDGIFRLIVEDNGGGISEEDMQNIFGKLLYGSKFHCLKSTRGQQGLGISIVGLYSYATTGIPIKVVSKMGEKKANYLEVYLDKNTNSPKIVSQKKVSWDGADGTKIVMDLKANYQRGKYSVEEYLYRTSLLNPHALIHYNDPWGNEYVFSQTMEELPYLPKEMKPHPHGIAIGDFLDMFDFSNRKTVKSFLTNEFCSISPNAAKTALKKSSIKVQTSLKKLTKKDKENLYQALIDIDLPDPPTDALNPVGECQMLLSLKDNLSANFYAATTRSPKVFQGMPFIVEAALAYGGDIEEFKLMRYANKVPLIYRGSSCIITECIKDLNWGSYHVDHKNGNNPNDCLQAVVHVNSVSVPFNSEAKEDIADFPEIRSEINLCLQELGRKLKIYKGKELKLKEEQRKRKYIVNFIPYLSEGIGDILDLSKTKRNNLDKKLKGILEKTRVKIR